MPKRWASIKLTLVLLYLGVQPMTPDLSPPFAFALLTLVVLSAIPLLLRSARALYLRLFTPHHPLDVRLTAPDQRGLLQPVAPGARGTVRSRAPSALFAARV